MPRLETCHNDARFKTTSKSEANLQKHQQKSWWAEGQAGGIQETEVSGVFLALDKKNMWAQITETIVLK